ncbi:heme o synthase [Gephyromycinifex aptenodytis]|uniref:heme o synthase n=1 Tax=Gephyromycinifex aptenodytis TaxID=2716227 RepID=UPI001444AE76|nr:heme o synthase [Gephyromycinifex aptenodytis]
MTALQPRRAGLHTPGHLDRRAGVRDYVALVKPRIIELLLITTFPVMFLAQRGFPPPGLIIATLVGGTLSAASANAFNCILDRDIDRLMHRTQDRPLVTGIITVRRAVIFATLLCVASVLVLQVFVNTLAASLSLGAVALYVIFYTIILKRRTAQNIVWGGAAGCMPVLIGWAAVTESLAWAPVVLFLVVFFWTPPHYWPLSMRFKDDYAAAGIPMLPVVAEDTAVARRIVIYSWATAATSLALVPAADMGWIYTIVALLAGGVFVYEAHQLSRRAKDPANSTLASLKPMRLFHYSISYLTILFVAVAIDPLVHLPLPF